MYVVVDFLDGVIQWQDNRLCEKKSLAESRMEFFKKKNPKRNYRIAKFTKFMIAG